MEKEQAKGLFCTLRGYSWRYLPKEIFVGIIIAAVSIPIAMGYAEVSGLPPVYGLYGSVLPIIVFAAVTRSRQFILGVDATPGSAGGGDDRLFRHCGRLAGSHGLCADDGAVYLPVAFAVLFSEGRQDREFHLLSGDGGIYQRYRC